MEFICLFFPALFSLKENDLKKKPINIIKMYVKYNILTNLISFTFVYFIAFDRYRLASDVFTISLVPKYLILSSFIAFNLPKIVFYFEKNFNIKIIRRKVKNGKKKN